MIVGSLAGRGSTTFVGALLVAIACCGCDSIVAEYGRRTGDAKSSVNGTAVFAEMFETANHRVSTATYLAPRIAERADVFVWFPDDFTPPDSDHRAWFEKWLAEESDRVLIYVGRDFDAEPNYWKAIMPAAPAEQQVELNVRLNQARARADVERGRMPADSDAGWFVAKGKAQPRDVRTLTGYLSWIDDIDADLLEIQLTGRLEAPASRRKKSQVDALLPSVVVESEGDALITERMVGNSKLLVVTNGSFLLNLPLVNHEHRKLAGKLIAECGDDRRVVFLESQANGPPIRKKDPETQQRSGLQIFTIHPFDLVLWHLCVLGLIFCLSRYPIFGRPRPAPSAESSDFHKHIAALGKLIERSGDRAAAAGRLEHFLRAKTGAKTPEQLAPVASSAAPPANSTLPPAAVSSANPPTS